MTDALPDPPYPAHVDLTHFDDMPLEVRRLRDSGIAGVADAEIFRCAVLLWCFAWHQLPAGSIPDDDGDLCRAVGLGRDLKSWARLRPGVLRGWQQFADGRLYHPVVSEKVVEGWNGSALNRWKKKCDSIRNQNKDRQKKQMPPLEFPTKPEAVPLEWPGSSTGSSTGKSAERKGREGKGKESPSVDAAETSTDPARAQSEPDPPETPPLDPTIEAKALAAWNEAAKREGWPEAQFLNSTRRWALSLRLGEVKGLNGWYAAINAAETAGFLKGRGWFDLDWMLKPENFTRLMEGRYAERRNDPREKSGPSAALEALAEFGRTRTG